MLGLKRGMVQLEEHTSKWSIIAEDTINILWGILGDIAVDIQHIGSTAIGNIHAKPIIDIVVGIKELNDIKPYIDLLGKNQIIFRKEDVKEQLLFVIGDFAKDTRTHHIHVVKWNDNAWNNYINFRDYLNSFPQKAIEYDLLKLRLAKQYASNRILYTSGKQELINKLLIEAKEWRNK